VGREGKEVDREGKEKQEGLQISRYAHPPPPTIPPHPHPPSLF